MHKPVWKLALIMSVASTFVLSFTAFAFADSGAAGKSDNVGTVMPVDALLGNSGVTMEKDTGTDATPAPTFVDNYSLDVTSAPSVSTDSFTETAKQTKLTPVDHLDPKQEVVAPAPCHDFTTLTEIPPMPSTPEDTSTTEIPISPVDEVTPAPSSPTTEEEPIFPAVDEFLDQPTTASDITNGISSSTDKTLTSMDQSVDGAEPTLPTEDFNLKETPETSLIENVTPAPCSPSSEPTVTTGDYELEKTPDLSLTEDVTPAPSSPLDDGTSLDSVKAPCPPLPTAGLSPTADQPVDVAEPAPPAEKIESEETPEVSLTKIVTPAPSSPSSEPVVTTGDYELEETPDLSLTEDVTPAPSSPLDNETSLDSVKAPCPPLSTAGLSPTADQPVDVAEPAPPAGEEKLEETPEVSLTDIVTPAPSSPSSEPTVTTGDYELEETPDLSLTEDVTPAPSSPLDDGTSLDSVKAPCPPLPTAGLSPTADQPVDVAEPAPPAEKIESEETPEVSLTEIVTPAPSSPSSEPVVTTGDYELEKTPDLSLTEDVTPAPSSPLDNETSLDSVKAPCPPLSTAGLSPTADQPVDVAEPAPPAGEEKLEETPEVSLTDTVTPAPSSPSSEPVVTTGDYELEETPDLSLTEDVTPAPSSPLDDGTSLDSVKAPCPLLSTADLSPTADQPVDVAEPAPPAGEEKLEETPEVSLTDIVTPAPSSPSSEPTVTTGDYELEETPDLSLTEDVTPAPSSPLDDGTSLDSVKAPCPPLPTAGLSPTADQPVDVAEPAPPAGEEKLEETPEVSLTDIVTPAPSSPSSEPVVTTGDYELEETPDLSLTDDPTPAPSSPLKDENLLECGKAPCSSETSADLPPAVDQSIDIAEPAPPAGENRLKETPEVSLTDIVTPAPSSPSSEPIVTTGDYELEETSDLSLTDDPTPAPSSPLDDENSPECGKAPCPSNTSADLPSTVDQSIDIAEPAPPIEDDKLEKTPDVSPTEGVTPAPSSPSTEPTMMTGDYESEETPDLSLTDDVNSAPSSPMEDDVSLTDAKAPCPSLSIAGSFSSAPPSASSLNDEDDYNSSTAEKAPCPSLPKAPCPSLPQPTDKKAKAPCPSLPQPQQGSGTGSTDQSVKHANEVKQMSLATSNRIGFAFVTVILSATYMLLQSHW